MPIILALLAPAAFSATECAVIPGSLFVGGDPPVGSGTNYFYISYGEGGAGVVYQSNFNYKSLLAIVVTAKASQRKIIVRYQADGVSCTAENPSPILGMWLI